MCNKKISWLLISILFFSSCVLKEVINYKKQLSQNIEYAKEDKTTIPFFYKNGYLFLRIKIKKGKKDTTQDFIFDSGALTLIFSSKAKALGLSIDTVKNISIPTSTVFGKDDIQLQSIDSLNFIFSKDLSIYKSKTFVLKDIEGIPEVAGLIGADIFKNFITEFDFENKQLNLYKYNSSFSNNFDNHIVIYCKANNNPFIKNMSIAGIKNDCIVDFGNPNDVVIQMKVADTNNQLLNQFCKYYSKAAIVTDAGKNTIAHQVVYVAHSTFLKQDNKTFENIYGNPLILFSNKRTLNMGLTFLKKNFKKIAFDWKNGRLYYTVKQPKAAIEEKCKDLYFQNKNGETYISLLKENSTWLQKELRPGFKIISINNSPPDTNANNIKNIEQIEFENSVGVRKTIFNN